MEHEVNSRMVRVEFEQPVDPNSIGTLTVKACVRPDAATVIAHPMLLVDRIEKIKKAWAQKPASTLELAHLDHVQNDLPSVSKINEFMLPDKRFAPMKTN